MEIDIKNKVVGIYCIKNIVNNKLYIGSSINIRNRLMKHRSVLRSNKHNNQFLLNSWNKYKEKSFECYLIEQCKKEDLLIREQFWINFLNPEYNLIKIVKRNTLTKESIDKISKTLKKGYSTGRILPTRISPVDVYDLELNFINSFNSIKHASIELNVSESSIGRVLNKTYKTCKGYIFVYFGEKPNKYTYTKKGVPLMFHDGGHTLRFISFTHAAKYFNVPISTIFNSYTRKQSYKNYKIIKGSHGST